MPQKLRVHLCNDAAETVFFVAGITAIHIPLRNVVAAAAEVERPTAKEAFMRYFGLKHLQPSQYLEMNTDFSNLCLASGKNIKSSTGRKSVNSSHGV